MATPAQPPSNVPVNLSPLVPLSSTGFGRSSIEPPKSGIGDAIGEHRPVSIAPQRLDLLAKLLGLKYRKSRNRGSSKTFSYLSSVNPSADEKKRKNLGFLHYKTQIFPAPGPGKKRILSVLIMEADGLEQGYFSRWPYVKLIHGNQVYRTPPANKSIANPVWNLGFKLYVKTKSIFLEQVYHCCKYGSNHVKFRELEEDMAHLTLEVWATRTMGSDWMMGKLVLVPAMRSEHLSEYWEALHPHSSALKFQREVTLSLLKRATRVAKRARERTPEDIMAKRLEIRKRKAQTIQAERDAIIAAGWGDALRPQKINKKRRLPLSIARHLPLICFVAFIIFIILIAFLPGDILTLFGF